MKTNRVFQIFLAFAALSLLCAALSAAQGPAGGSMGQAPGAQGQGGQGPMGQGLMSGMGAAGGMSGMGGMGSMGGAAALDPSVKRTAVTAGRASGLIYEPKEPGEKAHIGVFVMHYDADYSSFSACTELSKRGYVVLCMKNAGGNLNDRLLDIKSSLEYLRKVNGVQKVVLWGHSGGATLMTAYQLAAENGVKACQGPEKLSKCPNSLSGMPAADGLILADSNFGNAAMGLFSLDPAVVTEGDGVNLNQALNLFNPANGYKAGASSDYSQEFIRNFQATQAKRENALIKFARQRVAALEAGKEGSAVDEPLVVVGGSSLGPFNKLFPQDTKLMAHTIKPWPLIHADGSITPEIVYSVRPVSGVGAGGGAGGPGGGQPGGMAGIPGSGQPGSQAGGTGGEMAGRKAGGQAGGSMGAGFSAGGMSSTLNTTVRNFLIDNAVRVSDDFYYDEDSVHGVDWTSTYASPPGNVEKIRVPSLFMGMTGSYEYLAAETIYNNSAAKDKSLAFVEGASHMYGVCKQCEKTPGQYGDTIKTLYDYADKWLSQKGRFIDNGQH